MKETNQLINDMAQLFLRNHHKNNQIAVSMNFTYFPTQLEEELSAAINHAIPNRVIGFEDFQPRDEGLKHFRADYSMYIYEQFREWLKDFGNGRISVTGAFQGFGCNWHTSDLDSSLKQLTYEGRVNRYLQSFLQQCLTENLIGNLIENNEGEIRYSDDGTHDSHPQLEEKSAFFERYEENIAALEEISETIDKMLIVQEIVKGYNHYSKPQLIDFKSYISHYHPYYL